MHSSQCLSFNHDACGVKACQCICHDTKCKKCNGYGYLHIKLGPKLIKKCGQCGGRGRMPRNANLVIPRMKPNEDVPF